MLLDLFNMLRPPHPLDNGVGDADEERRRLIYETRVRAWRWRINNTMLCVVSVVLALMMATSPSGVPFLGSLAWANETNQRIQAAVQPVQSKVDQIGATLNEIQQRAAQRELSDLRQKLFETRVSQCRARGKGKGIDPGNPYSDRMGELQNRHYALTRTYYLSPDCSDL